MVVSAGVDDNAWEVGLKNCRALLMAEMEWMCRRIRTIGNRSQFEMTQFSIGDTGKNRSRPEPVKSDVLKLGSIESFCDNNSIRGILINLFLLQLPVGVVSSFMTQSYLGNRILHTVPTLLWNYHDWIHRERLAQFHANGGQKQLCWHDDQTDSESCTIYPTREILVLLLWPNGLSIVMTETVISIPGICVAWWVFHCSRRLNLCDQTSVLWKNRDVSSSGSGVCLGISNSLRN
jgi:hypothetical protein